MLAVEPNVAALAVPGFDADAAAAWLSSPDVVDAAGRVYSWHNPAHPGYAYPEAGGLWLSFAAHTAATGPHIAVALQRRVTRWLERCACHGSLGRGGRTYAFDTGVALGGLLAQPGAPQPDGTSRRELAQTMVDSIHDAVVRRRAVSHGATRRWSERFGPHLLKLVVPLLAHHDRHADPASLDAATRLAAEPIPMDREGRIETTAGSTVTYMHAHCYALEGLLSLGHRDGAWSSMACRAMARRGGAFLARIQTPDGGIPGWHDGRLARGPVHADATAQAIRIWACLDRDAYRDEIAAALRCLGRLAGIAGAVRYRPDSRDANTWATIFAVQASAFASRGGDPRCLI